jgi:D-glycero-D-manno-heptose 1,7-bisphosphate phosphatase
MRRALFLDRDGVLNALVRRDGRWLSPLHFDEFALLPGVSRAVRALRKAGLVALVVTNQPELTRGRLHPAELGRMHAALGRAIELDGIYVCPHRDADGCACRKPLPGLLLSAARHWRISLRASFLVGDSPKDIAAGHAAGCRTILVGRLGAAQRVRATTSRSGATTVTKAKTLRAEPDARATNLPRAAAWILAKLSRGAERSARRLRAEPSA